MSAGPTVPGSLVRLRRERVLDAMDAAGLDALVLGRQANATYAGGIERLWTAGTRPFGAGCVLIASTRQVHALSSWDAGIPEDVPFENLYPLTWNPVNMFASMSRIPGLADAGRIGVDALSPGFARATARVAPAATLEPADRLMASARRTKLDEELALIGAACDIARVGVDAVVAGVSTDPVAGAVGAMADAGTTIPSSTPRAELGDGGWEIDLGVMHEGYEGGTGGRYDPDGARVDENPVAEACTAGARWGDLDAVAGDRPWSVRGLGMGFELPLLEPRHHGGDELEPGMVLSASTGLRRDVVHVTEAGPVFL